MFVAGSRTPALSFTMLSPRGRKYTHVGTKACRRITGTEISREKSPAKEPRDKRKEDSFICFQNCLVPLLVCAFVIQEDGILNKRCETPGLTCHFSCCVDFSFSCEDSRDCCTVTSQNSQRGTGTFCSNCKAIEHLTLSPLALQTACFRSQQMGNHPLSWICTASDWLNKPPTFRSEESSECVFYSF